MALRRSLEMMMVSSTSTARANPSQMPCDVSYLFSQHPSSPPSIHRCSGECRERRRTCWIRTHRPSDWNSRVRTITSSNVLKSSSSF